MRSTMRRRAAVLLLAVLMGTLALPGCSGSPGTPARGSDHRSGSASSIAPVVTRKQPTIPPGRAVPALTARVSTMRNPVFARNFPDPGILRVGGLYYAYSTNSGVANVPVMTSPDLVRWTARGDALPKLPSWSTTDDTWAPEVLHTAAGYVLFFTAPDVGTGVQCIGRAQARSPLGPFVDVHDAALVCQNELGGSIDPSPYRAPDGSLYLLWKNDGNCCGYDVSLWAQRLSADGLQLLGSPRTILTRDRAWQGKLVEGPEMSYHGGSYWLFYAANDYASAHYAEGVARCRTPLGPCVDTRAPVLTSAGDAQGPGHAFVIDTPGRQTWLVYHAWDAGHIGGDDPGRVLWLSRVHWTASGPVVARPSITRQPAPR